MEERIEEMRGKERREGRRERKEDKEERRQERIEKGDGGVRECELQLFFFL